MFNHSFKSKYKKCFIVCILVMAMLLTAFMPINAMEENEQPESNTEKITEVQAEAPVVSEPKQVEAADAEDIANIEEERILAQGTTTEAPDVVGAIDKANQWQIVSEEYSGREQSNKKGYDIDKDRIDDVYYQKNVIPTGVENEFRVYMGITKRMSWDELLAESDFGVTTSKKYKTEGALENRIVGNSSLIRPGKSTSGGNNYEAVVTFTRG
ncbi:hypothetical protein, partial [Clostridium perfringens]